MTFYLEISRSINQETFVIVPERSEEWIDKISDFKSVKRIEWEVTKRLE